MMVGKEDLGLSLSLGSPSSDHLLTLMPPSSHSQHPSPATSLSTHQPRYWNDLFFSAERRKTSEMPFLRGIDVNRTPAMSAAAAAAAVGGERESEDDEAGASSPNSTLSSLSGKRGGATRSGGVGIGIGIGGDDHDAERESSRGPASDDEDGAGGAGSRKKLRLSKDQSAVLEESFKEHNTLNPKQKMALAKQLNLKPRQVEVWFQNRRARTKLKQTEVDCEFLKRCCESLSEENRRLQKEVQELRALKLISPQLYMQMAPPTTLTMCPSCERVSNSGASPSPPATETANERSRMQLHRPIPVTAAATGVGPTGPWAPMPVRPMFVDGPGQSS